jgi:hypothetical protein
MDIGTAVKEFAFCGDSGRSFRAIERGTENQEGAIGDYSGDRLRPAKELRSARGGRQDAARLNAGIHQRGRS